MDLTTTEGGKTDDDDDDPITGVSAIKKDIASNEAVPPSPPGDESNAKGADCGEYVSVKQEEDEGEVSDAHSQRPIITNHDSNEGLVHQPLEIDVLAPNTNDGQNKANVATPSPVTPFFAEDIRSPVSKISNSSIDIVEGTRENSNTSGMCAMNNLAIFTHFFIFIIRSLCSLYSIDIVLGNIRKSKSANFATMDVFQSIGEKEDWLRRRPILSKNQRKQDTMKFEQTFSRFNREFYFPKHLSHEFEKYITAWIMMTVLAVFITLAGFLIDIGVKCVIWIVYGVAQTALLDQYRDHDDYEKISGSQAFVAYFCFMLVCALFASCACYLILFFGPLAEGSGIPETKAYLNGIHVKGHISMPTLIAKSVGCALSIGSGLIAGREGPIIHVGAVVGAAVSQGSSRFLQMRLPESLNHHLRSAEWKRDFAVMGSALGVASAFIAPMGGVLFAIEEGTHNHTQAHIRVI